MLVSDMVFWSGMETARKITVEVPPELLEKAQRASGSGITQTVRTGLQLVAASHAYARLRQLRGKVRFTRTLSRVEGRPMIAVDTSTWIGFLEGDGGEDADLLDRALADRQVLMAPVVLTEMLSDPKLPSEVSRTLSELPLIEVEPGYWQRAGELRAKVLAKRRKARLGDALIAQSCIDCGIPLLTRDRDFRAFADAAGLDLVIGSAGD